MRVNNGRDHISSYNHKYVTEDISTHAKIPGKWYEKSEEPIVSMNYWQEI